MTLQLHIKLKHFVLLALLFVLPLQAQGFLRVSGQNIVNGSGNNVLLRGIGLGGWLVQEGYMFETSSFANAQWEIKQKIQALIGADNTEAFYRKFRNNFVQRDDIRQIKEWGFNSIRLPMHYNLMTPLGQPGVFIEEGFTIIDSVLRWCEDNQLYLILDLHAAPGGQNTSNISDYNPANPSLWQSETYRTQTVALWRKLAERYTNKEWIGGYDLLNETVWNFGSTNQPLRDLYIQITNAIRQVDTNHIIYIEGNNWANDFTTLSPAWDANMVYSFHKYWNDNSASAIQSYVNLRNQTNRPLWCGESGENSNHWFADAIALLEANNIGWAWWTHKKLETTSGLTSIIKPVEFNTLLNYWKGSGGQPTQAYAIDALDKFNQRVLFSVCRKNTEMVDALFRQPFTNTTLPYLNVTLPGIIYTPNYDIGKNNYAYKDNSYQNLGSGSYNSGWVYRNDGVDIERCSDLASNGYSVGWIETGEWLNYTVTVSQAGVYKVNFGVAAPSAGGMLLIRCDNEPAGKITTVTATGGWASWGSVTCDSVLLPAGLHTLTFQVLAGNFNFNSADFIFLRPTGVEKDNGTQQLKVSGIYPQPATNVLSVQYSAPEGSTVNIQLFDLLGRPVVTASEYNTESTTKSYTLPVNKLASGVYSLVLTDGKQRITQKVVVKH